MKQISTFLVLSVLTFGTFFLTFEEYKEVSNLKINGVVAKAKIENKYGPRRYKGKIQDHFKEWRISYSFKAGDVGVYRETDYVTKVIYDKYTIGDSITITYNPSKPYQSYIGNLQQVNYHQTAGDIRTLSFASLMFSGIYLLYLFYILFKKKIFKILSA